jgi:tetratricopeptide (TPR) repeat protein
MKINHRRCAAAAFEVVNTTSSRKCAAVVVLCAGLGVAAAGLGGCAGHGQYTTKHVADSQNKLSLLKSGTEWQMAQQQYLGGDFEKALKTVDRSIALNDKVAKSHVLRGRILIELSRLEQARASLLKAEEADPKSVDAQYFLGIIHERFSQPDLALERYAKAVELDSTNPQYLIAEAEMMVQLDRLDDAEQLLKEKRADFQFNAAVRQTLGHIESMRGNEEAGAQLYNEALLLAPDDLAIIEDLVRAQVGCRKFAEAELNLRRLLNSETTKGRRDLRHLQARCLVAVDRPVEARTILIGLTTDAEGAHDTRSWIDLGNVACVLGDDARIQESASRLIAIAPDRFEGYFFKAVQLKQLGDQQAALKALETAVSLAGKNPEPLMFKGMIQQDLGLTEEARASYAAAMELDPANVTTQKLLSTVGDAEAVASDPDPGN